MGHGHQIEYTVPSPDIYKAEDVPELKDLQEQLAAKGLKDPWIRNEVWHYTKFPESGLYRGFRGFTRGILVGFAAFVLTISVEKAMGITYEPEHDHEEHDSDGHH